MDMEWGHAIADRDSEIYSGGVVNVKVGLEDNEKTFQMHKALAIHHSGFFRGASGSDSFKEGATGEITLRDVDHETFALFLVWLYQGALPPASDWLEVYHMENLSTQGLLTDLCIFSDHYIVQDLHAHVLSLAIDHFAGERRCFLYSIVKRAFDNLPETSPYLKLVVDTQCLSWNQSMDDEDERTAFADLPATFLCRVMSKYADLASQETSNMGLQKSDYISAAATGSDHDEEPPAKKQKTSH
jgi:hypothetical protein